jgi:acyl-CoA dehydrogenase
VAAEHGGALPALDSRALVVLRETLAFHSPLADFAFAMQGLGSGAISLAGTPAQQAAYLPAVARGENRGLRPQRARRRLRRGRYANSSCS